MITSSDLINFRINLAKAGEGEFLKLFRDVDFYLENTPEHKLDDLIIDEIATTFQEILAKFDKLAVNRWPLLKTYLREVKGNSVNLARMLVKGGDKSVDNNFDNAVEKFKTSYGLFITEVNKIHVLPSLSIAIIAAFENIINS